MVRITVQRAGLSTTIQDEGRWGYQCTGVPVSGPMDGWSHRLANLLIRNTRDAATLEVTGSGPDLRFEQPALVAIAGARFAGTLDGRLWTSPVVLEPRAGSRLAFGERQLGMRAYVAAAGGFVVPPVLGSRATDVRSRLGGLDGRPVREGDWLHARGGTDRPVAPRALEQTSWVLPSDPTRLRVLRGPEPGPAADAAFERLLSAFFTVSPQSDRMGYRLSGTSVAVDAVPRISGPVATGVIQAPPSGEPLLLMSDRHTTGGYPIVAVVITADLPRAGQLGPGDRVAFEACGPGAAVHALIATEQILLALDTR
jgi:biotin-dependent carboxylase-like uncharacterized protein